MVHPRLPEYVLATHSLEPHQDVLKRVVERMPHVQRAGDVWWRNDDGKGLGTGPGVHAGAKSIRVFPFLGDFRFNRGGIVGLFKHFWTGSGGSLMRGCK